MVSSYSLRASTGCGGETSCVIFSLNIEHVASGSNDCAVKILDTHSGARLRTLTGHRGEVLSIAFSANGNLLASASNGAFVCVWELGTRRCLQ